MNNIYIKKNINIEIIKPFNNFNKKILNYDFFDNNINFNDFYLSNFSYLKLLINNFFENSDIIDYLKNFIKFFIIIIFCFILFKFYFLTKENI